MPEANIHAPSRPAAKAVLLAAALSALAAPAFAQTVGPAGEAATPSADITISDADLAALKGKGYKAALNWILERG